MLQGTIKKLNEENFFERSQSTKLFLISRENMKYLCGTIKEPKKFDLSYESWEAKNSMIISWLLNSMLSEIGEPFLYLSLAKEVRMSSYKPIQRKKTLFKFIS